jgi:hypothetical protein
MYTDVSHGAVRLLLLGAVVLVSCEGGDTRQTKGLRRRT